jgi:hypothetical protein
MLWQEDVKFPARIKPLPPGYKIVQLDSEHYEWTWAPPGNDLADYTAEGFIHWDRWWVRRCVFAHFEEQQKNEVALGK